MNWTKFLSRKFLLAAASIIGGLVGLFFGAVDDTQFVALVGVVLAAYGAANVAWQKTNNAATPPPKKRSR